LAQPFRYADAAARAEYILGRLRDQRMLDAVRQVSSGSGYASRMAGDLLRHPDELKRIDEFVGDHGLQIGRPIGSGVESVVWEALPKSDGGAHVLKVRHGGLTDDFELPPDVPGIVPYWAKEQAGPNIAAALQQKADAVFRPKAGFDGAFKSGAERLSESLLSRGWHWADRHQGNLGVMPDGTWGAIDGFIDRAHPSWTLPKYTNEEAIRMLRMAPREREIIYSQEP
jgi:hypothetical protein